MPESLIDRAQIGALHELLGDEFNDLIGRFQQDTARRCVDLAQAATADDRVALRAAAHSLKGAARNIGAATLSVLAEELERGAGSAEPARLSAMIAALEARVLPTVLALRTAGR